MALMPRGEPFSVPDPLGEAWDRAAALNRRLQAQKDPLWRRENAPLEAGHNDLTERLRSGDMARDEWLRARGRQVEGGRGDDPSWEMGPKAADRHAPAFAREDATPSPNEPDIPIGDWMRLRAGQLRGDPITTPSGGSLGGGRRVALARNGGDPDPFGREATEAISIQYRAPPATSASQRPAGPWNAFQQVGKFIDGLHDDRLPPPSILTPGPPPPPYSTPGGLKLTAPSMRDPTIHQDFGEASRYFESGNDPRAASSGKGDPGGKSYGLYQFATAKGALGEFLEASGYDKVFGNLDPNTPAFKTKWQAVATSDPKFVKAQHAFVMQTYFERPMERLQKAGIDLRSQPRAVQEAVLSSSVQYGQNSPLLASALEGRDLTKMSPSEIIDAIQDEKLAWAKKSVAAGKLKSVPPRIEEERSYLKAMIESDQLELKDRIQ